MVERNLLSLYTGQYYIQHYVFEAAFWIDIEFELNLIDTKNVAHNLRAV
jgi:hypothetical protein